MKEDHDSRQARRDLLPIDVARKNRLVTDWNNYETFEPLRPGIHLLHDIDLNILKEYIDWTFFFFSWKLSGKYPSIFNDPVKGTEARKLFDDAQKYLDQIISRKFLVARAVFALLPAAAEGDDVRVYKDAGRKEILTTLRFLRNQEPKEEGIPNLSLSDYIAPVSSGLKDNIGIFVVTAALDDEVMKSYSEDDYASIMIKILSDRIAEAAAEWLHERIRKDYWGYAADENLTVDDMLKVKYKGIRPAPGYPACPDHTEKQIIFDLLEAEKRIGARLTENFAMVPPASVSGYFFSHPASVYFNIGKINADQLGDYAERKNMTVGEAARWLAPNL